LRQISGSEVAVIAILITSPKMNGVRPALIVCAQVNSSDECNQVKPNAKIIALPRINAGKEVLNF
jgi:hypothetical protein